MIDFILPTSELHKLSVQLPPFADSKKGYSGREILRFINLTVADDVTAIASDGFGLARMKLETKDITEKGEVNIRAGDLWDNRTAIKNHSQFPDFKKARFIERERDIVFGDDNLAVYRRKTEWTHSIRIS